MALNANPYFTKRTLQGGPRAPPPFLCPRAPHECLETTRAPVGDPVVLYRGGELLFQLINFERYIFFFSTFAFSNNNLIRVRRGIPNHNHYGRKHSLLRDGQPNPPTPHAQTLTTTRPYISYHAIQETPYFKDNNPPSPNAYARNVMRWATLCK